MVRQKKTTNDMLISEKRFQMLEEIRARCAGHITAGLPPDSLESEQHSVLTEVTDPEEDKAEQPNNELAPAAGFGMEDAMAEFEVAQAAEMAEQHVDVDKEAARLRASPWRMPWWSSSSLKR